MVKVAIVGAGPGGALLAYLMARRGISVTLIEQHPTLGQEFRGERLLPGVLALFDQLGLGPDVAKLPQMALTDQAVYFDKKWLFTASVGALGRTPVFLPQSHLLQMLVDKASAFPNFSFMPGVKVVDVEQANGRITGLKLAKSDIASLSTDLVIAADGRNSSIRRLCDLDDMENRPKEGFDIVWTQIPSPQRFRGKSTIHMFLDAEGSTFLMPTPTDDMQVGSIIAKNAFGQMRKEAHDAWFRRLMRPLSDEILAEVRQHIATAKPSLLNVVCYTLPRWTKPGVMLIGDAAHPMSPAGAQGIFMAVRDAITLSAKAGPLIAMDADPILIDAACRQVEDERSAEVREMQDVQRQLGKAYLVPTKASLFRIRYVMPLIARLAPKRFAKMAFAKDILVNGGRPIAADAA